jgi:hypothetical protein
MVKGSGNWGRLTREAAMTMPIELSPQLEISDFSLRNRFEFLLVRTLAYKISWLPFTS